jgi:hypothetical protein
MHHESEPGGQVRRCWNAANTATTPDHHGPTLYYLTLPAAPGRRRHTLAPSTSARSAACGAFGAAILLLPLVCRRDWPDGGSRERLADGALARDGLLLADVHPESLFACFTLAFVIAVGRGNGGDWRGPLAGVAAGLALATKETSVIVLPALAAVASRGGRWAPDGPGVRWPTARGWAALAAWRRLRPSRRCSIRLLRRAAGVLEPFLAAGTYLDRGSTRPASAPVALLSRPAHTRLGA